jgi:hypothetical protein
MYGNIPLERFRNAYPDGKSDRVSIMLESVFVVLGFHQKPRSMAIQICVGKEVLRREGRAEHGPYI